MQDARILVTGGGGFIGSNLANTLAEENEVIALDNGYLGTSDNLDESVTYIEADVLDEDLPTDVDVVYHLAALSSRELLEENPVHGARVNVDGFVNVVEQAIADGCETIVYASTSSIYGSRTTPTPEDADVEAATGYDASMLGRERYAEYYNDFYADTNLTLAGMRFFSVYQGYGGAESHKGTYANTVSQFAEKIAQDTQPVLWGDGTQTRDFTHVDDIVRGLELAADHELEGVYNLGTGESYSFNEMVALINGVLGTDIEPVYEPIPLTNYVHDTLADSSKIRKATGWEPRIDFEEGVERVCQPYLDRE
ncbi:NAD-dependent epimerase/dehydratase family protein [Natrialba asiatica]|uniref:NAD-dependent epimerase/dehydratase n=1 Tax=Natrialba asiatica (strain ATCC 700177 / DSM 12278 / JCM 9576 / FERM P-10747 / NBRC 102637 / 172P1) TaxID=29540 RepID=M0B7S4_NATA1|nr:NAD-dependent epimerase/dehydratase family protein [Natrialba asiatica]ELZ05694.1 NAD-dependent epimerase/dehydratase [Natrialba asiatica DSM 12278]